MSEGADDTVAESSENGSPRAPNTARVVLAVVLVVALVGSLAVLLASRGSSSDTDPSGEVVLETAAAPGPDPYTSDVADPPLPEAESADSGPPFARPDFLADDAPVVPVSATEPGLYGGTRDQARCDAAQLVEFLEADPAKAASWAAVHDIEPSEIAEFVSGLTPVLLRVDTQVTNHGFVDGRANPLQSVLEAGTAVLVDANGVPRVKCNCGNPLLTARAEPGQQYVGDPWSDFEPEQVTAPQPGPTVDRVVLVDLRTATPYARPVGGDGSTDADAPPGTDVSDPIGRAADRPTGESGETPGPDAPEGPASIRLAPGAEETIGATTVEITASTIDLGFTEGGGPAFGPFTVDLRIAAEDCSGEIALSGDFEGTFDGAASLSGTWTASATLTPTSGNCDEGAITDGPVFGEWSAIFDEGARRVDGSMTAAGTPLFEFELQTG